MDTGRLGQYISEEDILPANVPNDDVLAKVLIDRVIVYYFL